MRTTLLYGVLLVNEVETSGRHHKQRRALSVYPPAPPAVKTIVASPFGYVRGGAT